MDSGPYAVAGIQTRLFSFNCGVSSETRWQVRRWQVIRWLSCLTVSWYIAAQAALASFGNFNYGLDSTSVLLQYWLYIINRFNHFGFFSLEEEHVPYKNCTKKNLHILGEAPAIKSISAHFFIVVFCTGAPEPWEWTRSFHGRFSLVWLLVPVPLSLTKHMSPPYSRKFELFFLLYLFFFVHSLYFSSRQSRWRHPQISFCDKNNLGQVSMYIRRGKSNGYSMHAEGYLASMGENSMNLFIN